MVRPQNLHATLKLAMSDTGDPANHYLIHEVLDTPKWCDSITHWVAACRPKPERVWLMNPGGNHPDGSQVFGVQPDRLKPTLQMAAAVEDNGCKVGWYNGPHPSRPLTEWERESIISIGAIGPIIQDGGGKSYREIAQCNMLSQNRVGIEGMAVRGILWQRHRISMQISQSRFDRGAEQCFDVEDPKHAVPGGAMWGGAIADWAEQLVNVPAEIIVLDNHWTDFPKMLARAELTWMMGLSVSVPLQYFGAQQWRLLPDAVL